MPDLRSVVPTQKRTATTPAGDGHELLDAVADTYIAAPASSVTAEKPSALLCFEREPGGCHRRLLVHAVAPDAEVLDLFA